MQTSNGRAITSGGDKDNDLLRNSSEFNFIGTPQSTIYMNYRTTSGVGGVERFIFMKGWNSSNSLSRIRALDIEYTGAVNNVSDRRLKRNITSLKDGAKGLIKQLSPILYLLHSSEDEGKTTADRYGFIAQEVQTIFPQVVSEDENGYLSLDYTKIIIPLIKAFQEHEDEMDILKSDIQVIKQ